MKRENATLFVAFVLMIALAVMTTAMLAHALMHDQTFKSRWDPVRRMAPSSDIAPHVLFAKYGVLLVCGTVCYDI